MRLVVVFSLLFSVSTSFSAFDETLGATYEGRYGLLRSSCEVSISPIQTSKPSKKAYFKITMKMPGHDDGDILSKTISERMLEDSKALSSGERAETYTHCSDRGERLSVCHEFNLKWDKNGDLKALDVVTRKIGLGMVPMFYPEVKRSCGHLKPVTEARDDRKDWMLRYSNY